MKSALAAALILTLPVLSAADDGFVTYITEGQQRRTGTIEVWHKTNIEAWHLHTSASYNGTDDIWWSAQNPSHPIPLNHYCAFIGWYVDGGDTSFSLPLPSGATPQYYQSGDPEPPMQVQMEITEDDRPAWPPGW